MTFIRLHTITGRRTNVVLSFLRNNTLRGKTTFTHETPAEVWQAGLFSIVLVAIDYDTVLNVY
jgi:hypothetical protein